MNLAMRSRGPMWIAIVLPISKEKLTLDGHLYVDALVLCVEKRLRPESTIKEGDLVSPFVETLESL